MTPGGATTNAGETRVTLALIGQTQNDLIKKVDKILDKLDALGCDIDDVEKAQAVDKQRIDTLEKEIDKIRTVNTIWSGLNSVAALIASALGIRQG